MLLLLYALLLEFHDDCLFLEVEHTPGVRGCPCVATHIIRAVEFPTGMAFEVPPTPLPFAPKTCNEGFETEWPLFWYIRGTDSIFPHDVTNDVIYIHFWFTLCHGFFSVAQNCLTP